MKILAVIPARAGSKGIPNKNVRILGGHPMVWYAIRNAKQSKYITDTVVTTDSELVSLIAQKENTEVRMRAPELCGDAVTLDAVVWDAIPKDTAWDYIVTLQPTSPTLTVATLDRAITYAISNGTDTLISCHNDPRLSWREKAGKKIPAYAERLNRQYLPADYEETGAFVISRFSSVSEKTRIGEKTDVFELTEAEAVDVDTFDDMMRVSFLLKQKQVGIYIQAVQCSMEEKKYRLRCALEIADEFYLKPDLIYDSVSLTRADFDGTTHTLLPAANEEKLLQICSEKQYTLFINIAGDTTEKYMNNLSKIMPRVKTANFDDYGPGARLANAVICVSGNGSGENIYSGEEYYLPSKEELFSTVCGCAQNSREKIMTILNCL